MFIFFLSVVVVVVLFSHTHTHTHMHINSYVKFLRIRLCRRKLIGQHNQWEWSVECALIKKPYHFSQSTNVKMHLCICAHQIAFELPLCTVSSRNISIAKNETLKKLLILLESELWRTKYAWNMCNECNLFILMGSKSVCCTLYSVLCTHAPLLRRSFRNGLTLCVT